MTSRRTLRRGLLQATMDEPLFSKVKLSLKRARGCNAYDRTAVRDSPAVEILVYIFGIETNPRRLTAASTTK